MIRFAESYATWLADYYLLALMLLALALATMASLKQPAQRLAIAKSTLVSLVLLAVLCAIPGWSVVHLFTAKSPPPIIETHEIVTASPVATGEQPRPATFAPPTSPMPQAPAPESKTVVPESSFLDQLSWPAIIACTHLVGVAGILGWLLLGWLAALRLRRTAIPAPPTAVEILNRLIAATHAQPPRVELFTHHRINVPVALGLWRPAIMLPPHFIESAIRNPQSEIAPILAHESAHVLNRDLIWVAVARVLLAALWANPLFWIARRRLRLDQEALADAAAAEITSRQQYAEQLVAWARDVSRRPALQLSSAVGLWEGPSQLRRRIAILLDEQLTVLRNCSFRWRVATALILIAGAAILSLVTIQPAPSQAAAKETKPNEADAPAAPKTGALTIRFEYDGVPPEPTELKEYIWPNLNGGVYRRIDVEKEVGATVFDESLVVGKDRGIANVFVWVRSKDIPNLSTAESVPNHRDPQQGMSVPDKYKGPPATLTYSKGRYEPHALAFDWPRQLRFRNADPKSEAGFASSGPMTWVSPLLKPGEERLVDVRPESLPVRMYGGKAWPWLSGWVLPLGHPYFGVSNEHGNIRIENLPPGKWEFQVWHERSGYLKTTKWPKGRFTLEIKPGANDLGVVGLSPEVFNESQATLPDSAISTGAADEKNTPAPLPVLAPPSRSNDNKNFVEVTTTDQHGNSLENVDIQIYRVKPLTAEPPRLMVASRTNSNGKQSFSNLISLDAFPWHAEYPNGLLPDTLIPSNSTALIMIVAKTPGRASTWMGYPEPAVLKSRIDAKLSLHPAATIRGHVTDAKGKPVVGAVVSTQQTGIDDIQTARTDEGGAYAIVDAAPFDSSAEAKRRLEQQPTQQSSSTTGRGSAGSPSLFVRHPKYAEKWQTCEKIPGTVDFVLEEGGGISGAVISSENDSQPKFPITVWIESELEAGAPTSQHNLPQLVFVRTDEAGSFQANSLLPGTYTVYCDAPGWYCRGVNEARTGVKVQANAITRDVLLGMQQGAMVAAQLVDATTGKPLKFDNPIQGIAILVPKPGGKGRTKNLRIAVDRSGKFALRLPPGEIMLQVMAGQWEAPATRDAMFTVTPNDASTVTLRARKRDDDRGKQPANDPLRSNNAPNDGGAANKSLPFKRIGESLIVSPADSADRKATLLVEPRNVKATYAAEPTAAKEERTSNILSYGDDNPDGKKSIGGSGEMIQFEVPEGVTKIKGLRIHGSRYGLAQAPKEDFEITFLNDKLDETLHSEAAPYRLFNRGKEQWVRVAFKNEVELPRKFWVCLNFNAAQTKGVYVSYDTSTGGEHSRVGLPGDKDKPKATDFKGDWMVQLILAKPEK